MTATSSLGHEHRAVDREARPDLRLDAEHVEDVAADLDGVDAD